MEAKRHEIEERHAGLLPSHPDLLGIIAIVLVSPIEPPIDDEEPD